MMVNVMINWLAELLKFLTSDLQVLFFRSENVFAENGDIVNSDNASFFVSRMCVIYFIKKFGSYFLS